jgi:hypothetical protein
MYLPSSRADVVKPHDPKLASIIEENAEAMRKLRDYLWERVETRVGAEWLSRHWSRRLPSVEKVLGLGGSSETAGRETLTDRAKKIFAEVSFDSTSSPPPSALT